MSKVLTFPEPSQASVLAIKGLQTNEFRRGGLVLQCSCTRAESKWNFNASWNAPEWRSVLPLSFTMNIFPPGWHTLNYSGPTTQPEVNSFGDLELNATMCGFAVDSSSDNRMQSPSPARFFAFRRIVDGCHTPVSLPINAGDMAAFSALSDALNRTLWQDCNIPSDDDPCDSCSANTEAHAIECESVIDPQPTTRRRRRLALDGPQERRIVRLTLRNLGLVGVLPVAAINQLSALRVLDLSNDPDAPFPNRLELPSGASCANIPICLRSGVSCVLDSAIPLCDENGFPITLKQPKDSPGDNNNNNEGQQAGPSIPVIVGASATALALVGSIVALLLVVRHRRNSNNRSHGPHTPMPSSAASSPSPSAPQRMGSPAFSTTRGGLDPASAAWKEAVDEATGAIYFINTLTGEFSWTSPATTTGISKAGSPKGGEDEIDREPEILPNDYELGLVVVSPAQVPSLSRPEKDEEQAGFEALPFFSAKSRIGSLARAAKTTTKMSSTGSAPAGHPYSASSRLSLSRGRSSKDETKTRFEDESSSGSRPRSKPRGSMSLSTEMATTLAVDISAPHPTMEHLLQVDRRTGDFAYSNPLGDGSEETSGIPVVSRRKTLGRSRSTRMESANVGGRKEDNVAASNALMVVVADPKEFHGDDVGTPAPEKNGDETSSVSKRSGVFMYIKPDHLGT